MKSLVIENPRYTDSGKLVKFNFDAYKLPSYSLAKSIHWKTTNHLNEYADILASRYFSYIRERLNLLSLSEKKPSHQEKEEFKVFIETFQRIFRINLPLIIKRIIEKDSETKSKDIGKNSDNHFFSKREIDRNIITVIERPPKQEAEQEDLEDLEDFWLLRKRRIIITDYVRKRGLRAVNSAIFDRKMYSYIDFLASSEMMRNVYADMILVTAVLKDMKRFKELEAKCSWILHDFITNKSIKGLDSQSQYQEGLLVIWVAAKEYEARNFARFTTFAKAALHFKFCNLLAFSLADKRKINRITRPLGLSSLPDTFMASKLDDVSFYAWEMKQREKEKLSEGLKEAISRAKQGKPEDLARLLGKHLRKEKYLERNYELSEFCEDESETIPLANLIELQPNKRGEMIAGTNDFRYKPTIFDQDNFPYLNEQKVELKDIRDYSVERKRKKIK